MSKEKRNKYYNLCFYAWQVASRMRSGFGRIRVWVIRGGIMEAARNTISKANGAFNQLQEVWKSSDVSLRTKLRIVPVLN
jgi:hypothetical protein